MRIKTAKNALYGRLFCLVILTFFPFRSTAQQSPNIDNLQVFPSDNPWNWDISGYQVHPNSTNYINSIGASTTIRNDFGTTAGIPYTVVNNTQTKYTINYTYPDESDPGPFPIPLNAPIEGGSESIGDRHVISVDSDNKMLYELYNAFPQVNSWDADCGAKFDLTSNQMRPEGWPSADASGLPIFPGLVRYEEVYLKGEIKHALRFFVTSTQKAYIWPARRYASNNTSADLPPLGLRLRLKSDFDISGFSDPVKVILTALKKYGMFVADVGANWFISGAPDERWNETVINEIRSVHGSDFEAVKTVDENGDPIYPVTTSSKESIYELNDKVSAFPNPFSEKSQLKFSLESSSLVIIRIYNTMGKEIKTLLNEWLPEGEHRVEFNGQEFPDGIYIYQILINKSKYRGKIIHIK